MLLYRDMNERLWRTNGTYLRFKDELNNEVTFMSNGHWVLKMISVPVSQLELARAEVKRIKDNQSKGEI